MNCLLKRCGNETLQAYLHVKDGSKIPFKYKEEKPRKYEEFNTFIQGMEFVTATVTISTTTSLALAYNDDITLDNGITLKVKHFEPIINARRAQMSRNYIERWIIDLR